MRAMGITVNLSLIAVLVVLGAAAPAATRMPPEAGVDVLVVGGTPGGVTAAVGAARAGASVLLVEPGVRLGGILSNAWLTTFDLNLGPDGEPLTRGVFLEVFRELGISFDPDDAARALGRLIVREPGVRAALETSVARVHVAGGRITGVEVVDRSWRRVTRVRPRQVVDATDDGDIAAAAGVPHEVGRAGYQGGERWMQAATLIFRMGGVDWERLVADISARAEDADAITWGVSGNTAWGYPDVAQDYRPGHPRVVLYPLNLARQRDGTVLINALNITEVDGLDRASVAEGLRIARNELPRLAGHLRATVPGFEGSNLVDHAPALYVRETRHVAGLYTLTVDDIRTGRVFDDRIAVASYPVDLHPYHANWRNPFLPVARVYTIPFRAIVPVGIDNLLMASRAFSATSEAHGSARVVPTVMALGQAAGVAAALCARRGCTPPAAAASPALVRELQLALAAQGAYLAGQP
ncbi:MAG: FAD-dependent oxidoreductase [Armatimonadota bacterium]|nr:FAD-dependent oxidoreductase [Armatimonadota bacterium]